MPRRHKGLTVSRRMPKKASTVYTEYEFAVLDGAGHVIPATSAATTGDIVGVIRESVASGDSDYADVRPLAVEIPREERNSVLYEVATSGAVAADVGKEVALTDSTTVNRASTATTAVRIEAVISATKVLVSLV